MQEEIQQLEKEYEILKKEKATFLQDYKKKRSELANKLFTCKQALENKKRKFNKK